MSGWLGTLELAAVAGLGFAAAAAVATALAWPALARGLARLHPVAAARAALGLAVAPLALALVALALCLAPGLTGALLGGDHCHAHAGHPHLCAVHPRPGLGGRASAGLVLVGGAGLLATAGCGRRLRAARRVEAVLARAPRRGGPQPSPGAELLDLDAPVSVTVGWWRPRVVLSRGLVERLAGPHLEAVRAHEQAHARRRDALRELAAGVLSAAHLPPVRRRVRAALHVASERACDEEAARRVGDRLVVAEALLAVERLAGAQPAWARGMPSFGASAVPARVRGLLDACPRRHVRAERLALLAIGAGAVLLAAPLHHLTEHLLAVLLGLH